MTLRDKFNAEILSSIERSREIGYNPSEFARMICNEHPVEVVKKLVVSGDIQSGFEKLIKMNKKELTIEFIMLKPEYKSLFEAKHLESAAWRLKLPK